MAAHHSSLLCAPQGLLLLLIGAISSHLPEIQSKPIGFWCNSGARKNMARTIEELKKDMLQQKRAEVVGTLRVFQDSVQGAKNQTTLQCQTSLLERLGHHVTNYAAIVSSLQIQTDTVMPSHSAVQNCSSQTNLNKVLEHFTNLLRGKLERLAIDLKHSICEAEHRATNT